MGSLFSRENKSKQSSNKNHQVYQGSHQPSRVSYHISNNVSNNVQRVERHAPSSISKNINPTKADYERKWADQRDRMMVNTRKHVLKAPATQQMPRKIQRQSTIAYQSTNNQQQPLKYGQKSYKKVQATQQEERQLLIRQLLNGSKVKTRQEKVIPSMRPVPPVTKIKQSQRNDYQNVQTENIRQFNNSSCQQIDFRQEKLLFNQFIFNQMLNFKLNRSKRLLTSFRNISEYKDIMISLVKQEISSGINQKIQQKKELKEKDCLKVYLQPLRLRSKFSSISTGITIKTRDEDKEQLQSLLSMGSCLCVITKSFPFHKGKLMSNEDQTYLCLISNFPPSEQIIAEGLQKIAEKHKRSMSLLNRNNIEKKQQQLAENEFYLFDITSVSSYQKQFIATLMVQQSPLVPVILSNKTMAESQKDILQRKRCLDIDNSKVYYQIVQKRNVSQVAAIKGTFQHTAGIFLIQGPPGTGKTQSITNLIALQYDRNIKDRKNMKILVCAQSNAAVDHIARKIRYNGLIGTQRRPNILKLGCVDQVSQDGIQINLNHICQTRVLGTRNKRQQWSATLRSQLESLKNDLKKARQTNQPFNKIKEIKKKLAFTQRQLTKIRKLLAEKRAEYLLIQMQEMNKCEIYFSTLNTSGSASTLKYIVDQISCLIVDQASQATQPSTLIPLLTKVKKMILVGDHKQLQPTVMSTQANYTMYNRSIFERMTDLGVQPFLLNVQYRMHPELSKFSSDFFYGGKVTDGECKDLTPVSLQQLQSRALFMDLKTVKEEQYKKSKINKMEAECIMTLIKILVRLDNSLQIGVIAPYKAQINLLEQKVTEEFKNRKVSIRVSTVDAFQGQQVDVVIFSCTRANRQNKIGFVSDPKRLNVAITRAKHALFVFGNTSTFRKDPTWKAYIEHHADSTTIKTVHQIVNCRTLLVDHIVGNKD